MEVATQTPMSSRIWIPLALVLSVGCGTRVHLGGDDGGGRRDAGGPSDAGGPPEPCGPVTCAPGLVCCNASCGVCTEPGAGCAAIACANTCMSNSDCGIGEYCAVSACSAPGVCVPRPMLCPGDVSPVCGCDGTTYSNACAAAGAGVSLARYEACDGRCAPADAQGEGPCAAILGVRWDGRRCTMIGGCSCTGADCTSGVYPDDGSCERAHAGCADCGPMDARGEGPCDAEIGVMWNGAACVTESGCGCTGTDCARLYPGTELCQLAHAHCTMTPECTSDADCPTGEHCYFASGDCGTGLIAPAGQCRASASDPAVCTFEQPPVCGCDGHTYACEAEAAAAGVSIDHAGACEAPSP